MSRPALKPFTPLAASNLAAVPMERSVKVKGNGSGARSYSFSSTSTTSTTSSVYSRAPEDLVDRLATHQESTTFQLWSAGNIRIQKLDLTIPSVDAVELVEALRGDARFEILDIDYLAEDDRDDWKVSFRRTSVVSPLSSPALSDAE